MSRDLSYEKVVFSLGILANAGSNNLDDAPGLAANLRDQVMGILAEHRSLLGEFEMVWGPAIYQVPGSQVLDNAMFAVRDTADGRVIVAVAGTSPLSVFSILFQDLNIIRLVNWPFGQDEGQLQPKIASGAKLGLEILVKLTPCPGFPGEGQTLRSFLGQAVQDGLTDIALAGHSLGGVLCPLLGLWLRDTAKTWDPDDQAALLLVPSAAPAVGNPDFARYYENRLGVSTFRIHNSLDVVPHLWTNTGIRQLARLYNPEIRAHLLLKSLFELAGHVVGDIQYTHVVPSAPAILGTINREMINPKAGDFWNYLCQFFYQHTSAYFDLLALPRLIDLSPKAVIGEIIGELKERTDLWLKQVF